ncbi:MAG: glycosyltransferase, partial [Desulfatitalea sp.]
MSKKVKVAVSYRVCQHWRVPIFRRLANQENIELKMFYGADVPGTKLVSFSEEPGFQNERLKTMVFRLNTSGRSVALLFCPGLLRKLKKFNPDVILTEGGSNFINNISVFIYRLISGTPVVWWTLGELPGRQYSAAGKLFRRIIRYMENKSDVLLGYSSVAMEYFLRNGYDKKKCFVAVNCIDTDKVITDIARLKLESEKTKWSLKLENNKVILFVGALTYEKNVDTLLTAFAIVNEKFPASKLIIVGDGPARHFLENIAKEYCIDSNCFFIGSVIEDVTKYFQIADIFVLPGLGGLAVSEALANGIPVICGQGDGCEVDLVINGETGYRYDHKIKNGGNENYTNWLAGRMSDLIEDDLKL